MSRLARRQPKVRARHLCAADAALLARETCTVQPRAPAQPALFTIAPRSHRRWATHTTPDIRRRPALSLVPDASAGPLAPWRRLPDASWALRPFGASFNSAAAALSPWAHASARSCICCRGARTSGRRARAFHTAASVEVERAPKNAIAAIAKPQLKPQPRCRAPRGCCPSSGTAPSPWP